MHFILSTLNTCPQAGAGECQNAKSSKTFNPSLSFYTSGKWEKMRSLSKCLENSLVLVFLMRRCP